jgi:5-methylcytosine-specific restriction endonuclease McrA
MELLSQANGEWLPMGAAASMIGVSRQALFKVAPKLLCAGAAYQRCNGRWMFCRSTVVDAYRDQTRPRSDSPIERDHRWMNGTDAARFLQISYSSLSSQYYSRLIDAGVARRNRSGQVLFLRSQALATALDAARDARRADIAARRADASIQRRRHLACVAAADTGDQWRTRIDFAGMVFPLLASKEKWILGTICVHGHTWPGTCLSLRRVYNGQVANCVECRSVHDGVDRLWWLRFVDWPSSPLPKGLRLGRLCPARHDWMSTGLSLREGGKCLECEKIRQSSPSYLAGRCRRHKQRKCDPGYVVTIRLRYRHKNRMRRAAKRGAHLAPVTPAEIQNRFADFGNCCAYCGKDGNGDRRLELEHFIPLSKGGGHVLGNMLPACKQCNSSKRACDPEQWYKAQPFFSEARWRKILRVLGKRKCDPGQLSMW